MISISFTYELDISSVKSLITGIDGVNFKIRESNNCYVISYSKESNIEVATLYIKETCYYVVWDFTFRSFFEDIDKFEFLNTIHYQLNKTLEQEQFVLCFDQNSDCSSVFWEAVGKRDSQKYWLSRIDEFQDILCVDYFEYHYKWNLASIYLRNKLILSKEDLEIYVEQKCPAPARPDSADL